MPDLIFIKKMFNGVVVQAY